MSSFATSYISSANSTKQPFHQATQQENTNNNINQKQIDKHTKNDSVSPSQGLLKQMEQLGIEKQFAEAIIDDLDQKDRFEDIVSLDYDTDFVLLKANDISLGRAVTIKVRRVDYEENDIRFKELIDKLNVFKMLSVNNPLYFVEIVEFWVVNNLIYIEEIDLMCEDLSDWLEARNGNALKIEERTSQVFTILRILLILENSGQPHNGINLNAFAVRQRQPVLFLSECQQNTQPQKPIQKQPQYISENNPKDLFNGLSDLCNTGLVICILENWKKFNNPNLDVQQLRNSLNQTGQLPVNVLGLDQQGLLYQLYTSMIRDGLLPKSQRSNTIQQYISILDKAKNEYVGIPHDSPFSKVQEEDKTKVIFLQNPSGVISSYIESVSRCQLKKSEEASTVIFSKPEQDKESKDEDFCLLQDSKEKHKGSMTVFGGNLLQAKWIHEDNKQESVKVDQSKGQSYNLQDDYGQKEQIINQNEGSNVELDGKLTQRQEKETIVEVEQKHVQDIATSERKHHDDYEQSNNDGVVSSKEIEQIDETPKKDQQLDGDVSVVHFRIAKLDKKNTIEIEKQQQEEQGEEESQQLNQQAQQQPKNIDLMKQSNTQFLHQQQDNQEELRQQQQQQQPKEIQQPQSDQQYQQSDFHPSWLSRLGDSYWNGNEIITEYKKYLKTLSIKCKHLEELHMMQGFEPTHSCLYQASCLDPIAYIKLTVQSQFNSLIGKGVFMAILVPFIKIFNRPWTIKNDQKRIGILFAHPLLWLLKVFNVIFMMILISFYFIFLLMFLTTIYLTYLILRIFLVFLIPVGLIRLHDRIAAKLSDFKATALYGRQISFTWYVLDADYRTAYDFMRFHSQVRRYQRALKGLPFQQQKALTLNNSTVSHNIL